MFVASFLSIKKNDAQSANEKSKHENKKSKKKKTKSIFEITYYNCEQKKHYTIKCFKIFKDVKIKINVNVVEQTKKKRFANFQKQQTNKKRIKFCI